MAGIGIIGIGNVLMGDDAAGPYAVKLIESRYALPEGVSAVEAGTPGFELAAIVGAFDVALIVDAVRADGPPGRLVRFDRAAITATGGDGAVGPHEPGLREALFVLEASGAGPREVLLFGVIPGRVDGGIGLTPEVHEALDAVVEEVVSEVRRRGITLEPLPAPAAPDLWWERGAR